jgi:aldose 1-epimerase
VKVTYSITADETLKWNTEATTDKKSKIVNLTNHFFNLNGEEMEYSGS